MFKYLRTGLPFIAVAASCWVGVAQADDATMSCASGRSKAACDVTMTASPFPIIACDASTAVPITFTINNGLPFAVPYSYTVINNGDPFPNATFTFDPASTCGQTTLQPGSCTLILDALPNGAPGCAEGNFNRTLELEILGTTQKPVLLPVDGVVSGVLPPTPPPSPVTILKTAAGCAILAGDTITNTGPSVITGGNVCLSPGTSITGFPPGSIVAPGTIQQTTTYAAQAQVDLTAAYIYLNGQTCTSGPAGPTDLNGLTLGAGVYCYSSSAQISTGGILNLTGNATDVIIFRIDSTLDINTGASIVLSGGLQAGNVYFVVGSAATVFTGATMQGNILALSAITIQTASSLNGRALARTAGAVTLDTNAVTVPAP